MNCPAKHPEQGQCRFDGTEHPMHRAGFRDRAVEWPNEDYRPRPTKYTKAGVVETIARAKGLHTV